MPDSTVETARLPLFGLREGLRTASSFSVTTGTPSPSVPRSRRAAARPPPPLLPAPRLRDPDRPFLRRTARPRYSALARLGSRFGKYCKLTLPVRAVFDYPSRSPALQLGVLTLQRWPWAIPCSTEWTLPLVGHHTMVHQRKSGIRQKT